MPDTDLRVSNNHELRAGTLAVEAIDLVRDILSPLLNRGCILGVCTAGRWVDDGLCG